jgi:hypothetical protein
MRSIVLSSVFILSTVIASSSFVQSTFKQQLDKLMRRHDMMDAAVTMLKNGPFIGDKVEQGLEAYLIFDKIDSD